MENTFGVYLCEAFLLCGFFVFRHNSLAKVRLRCRNPTSQGHADVPARSNDVCSWGKTRRHMLVVSLRAVFGSIHRTCLSPLVTDHEMEAWYHPPLHKL